MHLGLGGLWLFAILVVLEVTFSFDNAVINSKVDVAKSIFDGWDFCGGVCGAVYFANFHRYGGEWSWFHRGG